MLALLMTAARSACRESTKLRWETLCAQAVEKQPDQRTFRHAQRARQILLRQREAALRQPVRATPGGRGLMEGCARSVRQENSRLWQDLCSVLIVLQASIQPPSRKRQHVKTAVRAHGLE